MTGGIGTSQYTAPEVLRSERYDHKADVYRYILQPLMSKSEIAQFRGYLVGDSCSKDPILRHESNANSSGGRHARFAIQLLQYCPDFSLRSTATTSQELSCTLLAADAGAASSACSGKM